MKAGEVMALGRLVDVVVIDEACLTMSRGRGWDCYSQAGPGLRLGRLTESLSHTGAVRTAAGLRGCWSVCRFVLRHP